MRFINKERFALIMLCAGMGIAMQTKALPNVQNTHRTNISPLLRTAAGCTPATAAIDLDINNVQARLMTGGDMWWNIGTAKASYVVPKSGTASSQFASSCWIGGFDKQGQLKVAAQTYRQDGNDYWPGALESGNGGAITANECANWDQFWKIDKATINLFVQMYKAGESVAGSQFDVIRNWPSQGPNQKFRQVTGAAGSNITLVSGRSYAPFVDVNNDGIYNPADGDYPLINGDQYIWWVFNDAGNVKLQSQTASIGLEVQANSFAYSTNDYLNNATFIDYKIYNRGPVELDSAYMAVWDDCDLGWAFDDFIGCDTTKGANGLPRGLAIDYNGKATDGDGSPGTYGNTVPMVGLDFFKGPIRNQVIGGTTVSTQLKMTIFTYYNNDFSQIGNPSNGQQIYNYMTGTIITGQHFSDDFSGPGVPSVGYGKGPNTNFVYTGDPNPALGQWSECTCGDVPADRRFITSSGPFVLTPGAFQDITVGCVWVPNVGGCPDATFTEIRNASDEAQALFDNNFKTIEGPEAPRLVVRELDQKLVFYIVNDSTSNNFKEQYGYSDSAKYQVASVKAKQVNSPDSLYKFEGYRVFQLANSQVSVNDIFGTDGQVDQTKAREVFQCDIKNGIKTIINYTKRSDVSDSTYQPQIKVTGHDSGIVHSFEITQDAFSTTSNKNIINYQGYYYVALAYAYNNFAPFNDKDPSHTQDQPYLGSSHAAGGLSIPIITAIPNPANGAMGTTLNSDYGSGVIITTIAGTGNGGNTLQLTQQSEDTAILGLQKFNGQTTYADNTPTYQSGQGPVSVKVVDPVMVKNMQWTLSIKGTTYPADYDDVTNVLVDTNTSRGLIPATASWVLVGTDASGVNPPDTIYSEQNLSLYNEQILANYGISVGVQQTLRPGDSSQANNNGYISSTVIFKDSTKPWLAGVPSIDGVNIFNWLRSGNDQTDTALYSTGCDFIDNNKLDTNAIYFNMFSNYTFTKTTWGPYALAAPWSQTTSKPCAFEPALAGGSQRNLSNLPSVDLVFTPDTSKWTRCAVVEEEEYTNLAEGGAGKFMLRRHNSWDRQWDAYGQPIYGTDSGMSWFPGYAINEETGERLNIVFGEDSWMKEQNGNDMLWNPTATLTDPTGQYVVFGGKHIVYISYTRYDSDAVLLSGIYNINSTNIHYRNNGFRTFQWIGIPTLNQNPYTGQAYVPLLPLSQGLIPTETRLKFRVTRPYAYFNRNYASQTASNPEGDTTGGSATGVTNVYQFSTKGLAPTPVTDATNKNALLNRIYAVPNPYYGYSGYEQNRLDTKVRIINLPAVATINIFSLDGTLIRTLTKSDPNTPYIDWDIRNSSGLPIASGMYLIDVKAEGIGEIVLKWFGAMRPTDITTY